MEHSYRQGSTQIHDLLLFGSVLDDTKEPHDLDLLIIHTLAPLVEFGVVTRYTHQTLTVEPDLEAQWSRSPHSASSILYYMGSSEILDLLDVKYAMRNEVKRYLHKLALIPRPERSASSDTFGTLYVGSGVSIPLDGLNYDDPPSNYGLLMGKVEDAVETIQQETVLRKVTEHLESKNLVVDETLDMHCITTGILSNPDDFYHRKRATAIHQSKDPRFWPDILSAGRLYNPETKEFNIPLEQKYPGAVQLFTP